MPQRCCEPGGRDSEQRWLVWGVIAEIVAQLVVAAAVVVLIIVVGGQ